MSTSTLSTSTSSPIKNHDEYYNPTMDLTIIVGDTRFRQASYFFARESPVFRERIAEATEKNDITNQDDTNNHTTIVIEPHENVGPDDFAELCSIFTNPRYNKYDKSLESWKTILRLANQWSFPEVKELAFRQLSAPGKFPMSPVERIVLYRQYNAENAYLEPLYEELLTHGQPFTEKEGEALGPELVSVINEAWYELRSTLPEGSRTERLPLDMKDTILEAAKRLAQ